MAAPWAGVAEARIMGKLHGQDTVNVLYFATNTVESDVSPPSPLLLALVTAILECVIETLLPGVTQDWTCEEVNARYVYNTGSSPLTDPVVATADAGSIGELGATSVSFAASLVHLRTGLGGQRGRGRMFLPPPGESNVTASAIDSTTTDLLVAFLTCMAGKFLGASPTTAWRWGVLSRKDLSSVGGTYNNSFRVISQATPSVNLAVIGRRRVGHGN
jgi:hypothetical protein